MVLNRRLKDLEAEVQTMKTLLFELYPGLDASSTQHIRQTLHKVCLLYPQALLNFSSIRLTNLNSFRTLQASVQRPLRRLRHLNFYGQP